MSVNKYEKGAGDSGENLYSKEDLRYLELFEEFTGPASDIQLSQGEWFDKNGHQLLILTGGRVQPEDKFQIAGENGNYECKRQPIKIVKFGVVKPQLRDDII